MKPTQMWESGDRVCDDSDGVQYRIFLESENEGPEGFFASGDEEADRTQCEQIRADLNRNPWAWCCVLVLAKHEGSDAIGVDSLGGCSYSGRADFIGGGYFDDMKSAALADLLANLERLAHPTPDLRAAEVLAQLAGR